MKGTPETESPTGRLDAMGSELSPSRIFAGNLGEQTVNDTTPHLRENNEAKTRQRDAMLKKIEEALRKSFERKQDQIKLNL